MKDLLKGVVFIGIFLIPFLPVIVLNGFFFPFITGKNFAFRIIVEVVFAAWILLAIYEPQYRPRFSWILAGFASLLGVMAVADALGAYPLQSFWSNFERMDGYVTLVHLFMYIVVAGSVLTAHKLWSYFIHTSVTVALCVALYGLAQNSGIIGGGRTRVESLLGNAAYMAVYMLFHIFMLLWLFVRAKANLHKAAYILAGLILSYTLLLTGTRGTFLGLIVGLGVTALYITVFGRKYPELRKVALGACVALVVIVGGFWMVRDTAFVQNQNALARIANISIGKDLVVREKIWTMAWEGVKERPILGWGQSNFNYVFNKQYDPSLYAAESWFDRTHDIFFDWLIAGGVLGLIAYFSIFIAALYYLVLEPIRSKEEPSFTVLERGVLLGLLIGYLVHNIVVFDNIISYIFYASILALIHSRVAKKIDSVESFKMDTQLISQFVFPLVVLITGATVYFVNVPAIGAATDIIGAMTATSVQGRLEKFHSALERHSFADQEIVEQLAQQAMDMVQNPNITADEKKAITQRAELELLRLNKEKPGDARLHSFLASFYRSIGALPEAKEQAAIARQLSPKKQSLILEQGIIELQMGKMDTATEFLKTAFELDESNTQARILYAAILIGDSKKDEALALVSGDNFAAFADNDFALSMVDQSKDLELLAKMFEARVASHPDVVQNRASLAYVYYEMKQNPKAIEILETASKDLPEFSKSAQCFITNLKKGVKPDEGC